MAVDACLAIISEIGMPLRKYESKGAHPQDSTQGTKEQYPF